MNDFDEAAHMPYAFDLVRLAASASLAPNLRVGKKRAAAAILTGRRCLTNTRRAFGHLW